MTTSSETTAAPATEAAPKTAPKPKRVNWHERYDDLKACYEERDEVCDMVIDAVANWHDENHTGAFRHCGHPICEPTASLLYLEPTDY